MKNQHEVMTCLQCAKNFVLVTVSWTAFSILLISVATDHWLSQHAAWSVNPHKLNFLTARNETDLIRKDIQSFSGLWRICCGEDRCYGKCKKLKHMYASHDATSSLYIIGMLRKINVFPLASVSLSFLGSTVLILARTNIINKETLSLTGGLANAFSGLLNVLGLIVFISSNDSVIKRISVDTTYGWSLYLSGISFILTETVAIVIIRNLRENDKKDDEANTVIKMTESSNPSTDFAPLQSLDINLSSNCSLHQGRKQVVSEDHFMAKDIRNRLEQLQRDVTWLIQMRNAGRVSTERNAELSRESSIPECDCGGKTACPCVELKAAGQLVGVSLPSQSIAEMVEDLEHNDDAIKTSDNPQNDEQPMHWRNTFSVLTASKVCECSKVTEKVGEAANSLLEDNRHLDRNHSSRSLCTTSARGFPANLICPQSPQRSLLLDERRKNEHSCNKRPATFDRPKLKAFKASTFHDSLKQPAQTEKTFCRQGKTNLFALHKNKHSTDTSLQTDIADSQPFSTTTIKSRCVPFSYEMSSNMVNDFTEAAMFSPPSVFPSAAWERKKWSKLKSLAAKHPCKSDDTLPTSTVFSKVREEADATSPVQDQVFPQRDEAAPKMSLKVGCYASASEKIRNYLPSLVQPRPDDFYSVAGDNRTTCSKYIFSTKSKIAKSTGIELTRHHLDWMESAPTTTNQTDHYHEVLSNSTYNATMETPI